MAKLPEEARLKITVLLDEALHRVAVELPVTAEGTLTQLEGAVELATVRKCEWYFCPEVLAAVPIWQYSWGKAHDVCAAARDQVESETTLAAIRKMLTAPPADWHAELTKLLLNA